MVTSKDARHKIILGKDINKLHWIAVPHCIVEMTVKNSSQAHWTVYIDEKIYHGNSDNGLINFEHFKCLGKFPMSQTAISRRWQITNLQQETCKYVSKLIARGCELACEEKLIINITGNENENDPKFVDLRYHVRRQGKTGCQAFRMPHQFEDVDFIEKWLYDLWLADISSTVWVYRCAHHCSQLMTKNEYKDHAHACILNDT